jgi:hypothetical protein
MYWFFSTNTNQLLVFSGMIVTAFIVSGIFTYIFYDNICTGVLKFYKILINNSLTVVTVVVILGVFIYILYYHINIEDIFPIIYCYNLDGISHEVIMKFITNMHLQPLSHSVGETIINYDINDTRIYLDMLSKRHIELNFNNINGVFVNTIKVNNRSFTVNPNVMNECYRILCDHIGY